MVAAIRSAPDRVLGAVDETGQVAIVEVAEAVRFVDGSDTVGQSGGDLRRELVAQVHPLGADVKEQVARRRRRETVAAVQLTEGVQVRWAWRPEQSVPRV